MGEHKTINMTGYWEMPEKERARTATSANTAPQNGNVPQDQKRIADWLRRGIVDSKPMQREATKE